MQCPPTSPGLTFEKFHFDEAHKVTSSMFIFSLSQYSEYSLASAISRSRCTFSYILAASATFMHEATTTLLDKIV